MMIASFLKRLSRLSLSAPPAAIVLLIPFTYNLLKKHPSLMVMIHRQDMTFDEDPFNMAESNPYLTNAIDSSLWELASHRTHYHHVVSTLAGMFEDKFTKPQYGLEDFLDHTYNTVCLFFRGQERKWWAEINQMFCTEMKGKLRGEPPLALEISTQIFDKGQQTPKTTLQPMDAVRELWTFWIESAKHTIVTSYSRRNYRSSVTFLEEC